jgi:hypothetical protein
MPLNVTLADQIPLGYSGFQINDQNGRQSPILLSERFQQVVSQYQQRQPIAISSLTGCRGICTGELEGAGLQVACEPTTIEPVNVTEARSFSTKQPFGVSFAWSGTGKYLSYPGPIKDLLRPIHPVPNGRPLDEPFIYMNITWSPNGTYYDTHSYYSPISKRVIIGIGRNIIGYTMFVHQSLCRLYPGSASYPVIIRNGVTTTATVSQPVVDNMVELNGPSTFLPGSYQNTRKMIDDCREFVNKDLKSFGGYNRSDLAMKPSSPDYFNTGSDSYHHGTLAGLAIYLQNVFNSSVYLRNGSRFSNESESPPQKEAG